MDLARKLLVSERESVSLSSAAAFCEDVPFATCRSAQERVCDSGPMARIEQ